MPSSHVSLKHPGCVFINGRWVPAAGSVDILSAHDEQPFASVALASERELDLAVDAARRAFDDGPWPQMSHRQRADMLRSIAELIDARVDEFAHAWTNQVGVPFRLSTLYHGANSDMFRRMADLADVFPFREIHRPSIGSGTGLLVREPVGVVAAIVPWNAPLMLLSIKLAPALLAGCTIILKASPEAPMEAMLFAEICEAAGLPPGVVNVIPADRTVSELLVRDARVDKVSFTGSSATGRKIASICGDRIARFTLELGGKSAAVVLDDYDVGAVASAMREAIMPMTGQACSLPSRVIVSRARHDALVEAMADAFGTVRVGNPYDDTTDMGPLATRQHLGRVTAHIAQGKAEGAILAHGGSTPMGLDQGWFVEPTVFAGVTSGMRIAQEEIFGPVIAVMPADDDEDAIRIANDTIFGLNSVVFTDDLERAYAVAQRMRTGNVGHNGYWVDTNITFGGFKQSGSGREGGRDGLLAFLETKTILLAGTPAAHVGEDILGG